MPTPNPPRSERQPKRDADKTAVPPSAQDTKRPTDSLPMQGGASARLPQRFGRYDVERLLGRGAMGSVYLARDRELDRLVALKIPRQGASVSKKLLQRLKTEAQAAAQIDHPNVCPVYDAGEIEGTPFIAMQYVEGETLKEHLRQTVKTPKEAEELVRRLAEGLAAAHAKRILHRDLKPENIKLKGPGFPIIMDFGLAKRDTVANPDASATRQGSTLGSPAYMSPEQAVGNIDEIDQRSDIYALGVILYEMLTGQWPFTGSALQVMAQKATQDPPSPLSIKPQLPGRLAAVCMKMIARDRAARYRDAREVIAALEESQSDASAGAVPASATSPKRESAKRDRTAAAGFPALVPDDDALSSLIARRSGKRPAALAPKARSLSARVASLRGAGPVVVAVMAVGALLVAGVGLWLGGAFEPGPRGARMTAEVDDKPLGQETGASTPVREGPTSARRAPNTDGRRGKVATGDLPARDKIPALEDEDSESLPTRQAKKPRVAGTSPLPVVLPGRDEADARAPARDPESDGFVALFNGRDLSGWKTHPSQPGNWRVEDGVLIGSDSEASHLYSERRDFGDFHLRVRARINAGGNSGVYFRAPAQAPTSSTRPLGYEAQINSSGKDLHKSGSLYISGAEPISVKESWIPPDEWFLMEIIAERNHITIKLNDRKTVDFIDRQQHFSQGCLALQVLYPHTIVEFSKVEIKQLPAR